MKKTCLVLLLSVFSLFAFSQADQATNTWSKSYRDQVYSMANNSLAIAFPNDSIKNQYLTLMITKLERALPNGLQSVPSDSLSRLAAKFDAESKRAINNNYLRKWSPEFEKSFRSYLYERLKKTLPEDTKSKLCDCMVPQYKIAFPQGMPGDIPIDKENRILGECYVQVMIKKN